MKTVGYVVEEPEKSKRNGKAKKEKNADVVFEEHTAEVEPQDTKAE